MIFACQRSSLRLRKCSPDLEVEERRVSTTRASFSGRVRARLRLRSGVQFAICCEVDNCAVGGRSIGVEDPQVVSCTLDCLCIVPQYARSAGVIRSRRIGFSGSSMVGKTRSRNSRSAGVSGEQPRAQAPVSEVSSSKLGRSSVFRFVVEILNFRNLDIFSIQSKCSKFQLQIISFSRQAVREIVTRGGKRDCVSVERRSR